MHDNQPLGSVSPQPRRRSGVVHPEKAQRIRAGRQRPCFLCPLAPFPSLRSLVTLRRRLAASSICEQEPVGVDLSLQLLKESLFDVELLAAVRLRIRTFYDFNESCGVEYYYDYRRSLVEREYEALKERIADKRMGFKRFSDDGEDHIIVGTLDINQCFKLANELTGKKPEGLELEGEHLRKRLTTPKASASVALALARPPPIAMAWRARLLLLAVEVEMKETKLSF